MTKSLNRAALAAGMLFGALMLVFALLVFAPAAKAQHVIDPAVVHAGADSVVLVRPSAEPSAQFETAALTSAPIDGEIIVPWGDWLSELLKAMLAIAGAAVLWLLRRLPSHVVDFLDMLSGMAGQGRANELLEKALGYGINTTAGAVRGKALPVKVGNEVLERALEYALRHAPMLVEKIGGVAGVREKIIARLELEPDAALPAPRPPATQGLVSAAPEAPAPQPQPAPAA